MNHTRTNLWQK